MISKKLVVIFTAFALSPFAVAHAENANSEPGREQISADQKDRMQQRREEMKQKAQERFKQADTNGDGNISMDEAKQGIPKLAEHFNAVDANHDGQLSPDEMHGFAREKAHERHADRVKSCGDKAGKKS